MSSTKQDRVIERVDDDSGKIDKVDIVDANNTKTSKSVKSQDFVKLKETGAGFLISETRLIFT